MECRHVREAILESFDDVPPRPLRRDVEAHLAGCAACAAFAARQRDLDARLTTMLVAPEMSPALRSALRTQIHRQTTAAWLDSLPDVVHFLSCSMATLWCVIILPFDAVAVAGAGTTASLLTYALLTMVRHAFDDAELVDR